MGLSLSLSLWPSGGWFLNIRHWAREREGEGERERDRGVWEGEKFYCQEVNESRSY
jgi:hypothetical protein